MTQQRNLPSIDRLADLQQLIANLAEVKRMVNLTDSGRLENDAEHSYGLALTCWFLAPKVAPKLNQEKILKYALAHDIVEVHSGDVFAFDEAGVKAKPQREKAALQQLRGDWPDFPELDRFATDYMDKIDPEARFVYTIDKILPSLMINLGEKEIFWNRHKITQAMEAQEKHKKMKHSPEALPYLDMLLEWMADPDYFYKPGTTGKQG